MKNWYGIEGIHFIWNGCWNDPQIEYNGYILNSHIVEDTMWERYNEDIQEDYIEAEMDFEDYMKQEADEVKYLIELALGLIED